MRASKPEGTGTAGQSAVAGQFEQLGWGVSTNPDHDLGTDLWLMARDARRFDLMLLVGAQVKTSERADSKSKYFKNPVHDEAGELSGWWFYEANQEHFKYWLEHSVPHIVVLHSLDDGLSYWAQVTDEAVEWTPKGAKVLVPRSQTVDVEHVDGLLAVATSQRAAPVWEGSAWTGAEHVSPQDKLRYALVTPRLVAPHPNTSPVELTPSQAIAMLVQGRTWDLDRFEGQSRPRPIVEEASQSPDWEWRLFAALRSYLDNGELGAIDVALKSAAEPHQRAAVAVIAASSLLEDGKTDAALGLLDVALGRDEAEPVDHAWLQVQKGRCLRELGRMKEARELGIEAQHLRTTAQFDATAMAIAAAATELVFATSGWDAQDVRELITVADTAAAWWRSQVIAWGLDKHFEEGFKGWAGDSSFTFGGENTAWLNLRAASLMSGFAGDHRGWGHAISLLARLQLETTDCQGPIDLVAGSLTTLRLAGDESSVGLATQHAVTDGPAEAVRRAGRGISLESSTTTSSKSNLIFITRAADVLDVDDADRHARWALRILVDPADFVERVQPTYFVAIFVLEMLEALVPAISPDVRRQVLDHLGALPTQSDQSVAHSYASLVRAFESHEWSDDDRKRIAQRKGGDNWELTDAFEFLLAEQDVQARRKLLDDVRNGSLRALTGLRDVRDVPPDVAAALVESLSNKVRVQITESRQGAYGMGGGIDLGECLTLVNMWHPDLADWEPVRELLAEPASHPDHVVATVRILSRMPGSVPLEVADALEPALRNLRARQPLHAGVFSFSHEDVRGIAAEALDALNLGDADDASLWTLMAGDRSQRRSLALIVARRRDPAQLNLLASLAHDSDATVREIAAHCIARWATDGIAIPGSQALLMLLLGDPGVRLARSVTTILSGAADQTYIVESLQKLQNHISATVRRRTEKALGLLAHGANAERPIEQTRNDQTPGE
jgi:Domain of unknown function (DUF4365)